MHKFVEIKQYSLKETSGSKKKTQGNLGNISIWVKTKPKQQSSWDAAKGVVREKAMWVYIKKQGRSQVNDLTCYN